MLSVSFVKEVGVSLNHAEWCLPNTDK